MNKRNLNEELKLVKKQFKDLRQSLFPYGVLSSFKLSLYLPFYAAKYALDYSSGKTTLNYTNLFASKVMYEFDGHKLHSFVILTPLMSTMTCGISVLTVADQMSMAVFADEVSVKDPKELMDIIIK